MAVTGCKHYWIIEEPNKNYNNGITSNGICKYCSHTKEFSNSYDSIEFNRTPQELNKSSTTLKTKRRKPQLVSYQQRMWKIKNHGL